MLDRLVPPAVRERLRALAARLPVRPSIPGARGVATGAAAVPPGLGTPPAPMAPLDPPAAINDNPLRSIEEAVERELRARGHLR